MPPWAKSFFSFWCPLILFIVHESLAFVEIRRHSVLQRCVSPALLQRWSQITLSAVGGSEEEEERAELSGRPPVIPFDFSEFARQEKPPSRVDKEAVLPKVVVGVNLEDKSPQEMPRELSRLDYSQPTGYANDDEDDLAPLADPTPVLSNPVLQFLKQVYIGRVYTPGSFPRVTTQVLSMD